MSINEVMIGSKDYFEEIRDKYLLEKEDRELSELREVKWTVDAKEIDGWIKGFDISAKEKRKCLAYALKWYTPLKLTEISKRLGGLSYSGVSQLVSRLANERTRDRHLSRALQQLDTKMSNAKT